MTDEYQDYKPDDWVRVCVDDKLVIVEVRYLWRYGTGSELQLVTDQGIFDAARVLERRSLADYVKGDE